MKRIKFLTGLVGNGIIILFIVYLSADLFSWLTACLVNLAWIEPSFPILCILIISVIVVGVTGLLHAAAFVFDSMMEVWEGQIKSRLPRL